MRIAGPLALTGLTGLLGLILVEVLKILLAPVAAWLLVVFMTGLKVGLAILGVAVLAAVTIFVVRRTSRARAEAEL